MPPSSRNRYAAAAIGALLLLLVALVFGQTVRHGFLDWDDPQYVYENPQIMHGFTSEGIDWAFTQFYSDNWHPLTWLSHMLDCQIYGVDWPGGHHLTNVLLHAASSILLFLVLRQITGDLWPSALVAVLFAIHPLHVESVAWVAERKDVLSGLFFMLTLAAYVGYARRPFSLFRYLLVTVLFALGLMAKPMLVTLPLVLLLLDYWPLGRLFPSATEPTARIGASHRWSRVLLEKLPWLALTVASCVVTRLAQQTALASLDQVSSLARIDNAIVSYAAYLGQFFYPVGLAVHYPHLQNALPAWKVVGSLLLLVGVSVAVVAYRRKCPCLLVGWLWYLGTLVPVIGLVQVGNQAMADRYTYLTQIGLYVGLVWGAEHATRHWPHRRRICGAVSAIIVVVLTCRSWQQASYWKDDESLWKHAIACTPKNAVAYSSLGITLADDKRFDESIVQFEEALKIQPDFAEVHSNLGYALVNRGRLDEAIAHFQEAIKVKPDYATAHRSLRITQFERERILAALAKQRQLCRLRPQDATLLNNTAWLLATNANASFRNGAEAVEFARQAVTLTEGQDPASLRTLAAAYAETGWFSEALQFSRRAAELARQQDKQALAESIQAEIRLYEAKTPLRESPASPAKTSSQP